MPPAEGAQGVLWAEGWGAVSRVCSGHVVGSQGAGPDLRTTLEVNVARCVAAGGMLGPQARLASAEDYGGNRCSKGTRDRQEDTCQVGVEATEELKPGGAEDHGSRSRWHPSLWPLLPAVPGAGARPAPLHPTHGQVAPCDLELPLPGTAALPTWPQHYCLSHLPPRQTGSRTRPLPQASCPDHPRVPEFPHLAQPRALLVQVPVFTRLDTAGVRKEWL